MPKCIYPCESRGMTVEASVIGAEEQPQVFLIKFDIPKVYCTNEVGKWGILPEWGDTTVQTLRYWDYYSL